jgi:hypothetical protein
VVLELNTEESGSQALRVNSCVSCIVTKSDCCFFPGSFPSSEFP